MTTIGVRSIRQSGVARRATMVDDVEVVAMVRGDDRMTRPIDAVFVDDRCHPVGQRHGAVYEVSFQSQHASRSTIF